MTTKSFALATLMPSGGTIAAPLLLGHTPPTAANEASSKSYVDTTVAAIGGIPEAPISTTVSYGRMNAAWTPVLAITGGTLTGPLVLAGDPGTGLGAATRQYVDAKVVSYLPLAGGTLLGPLNLPGNPPNALAAAPKQYVDSQVALMVPLAGGTMTGSLVLNADPVAAAQAATKNYVDVKAALYVPLAGGTMTGSLVLKADPTVQLGAATKAYVDAHAGAGGIVDAPSDGTTYGRNNAAWVNVLQTAGGTMTGPLSGSGTGQTLDNFNIDMGTF